eukprot:scaffold1619_cov121-Isochrysis_galbana.AAC.4
MMPTCRPAGYRHASCRDGEQLRGRQTRSIAMARAPIICWACRTPVAWALTEMRVRRHASRSACPLMMALQLNQETLTRLARTRHSQDGFSLRGFRAGRGLAGAGRLPTPRQPCRPPRHLPPPTPLFVGGRHLRRHRRLLWHGPRVGEGRVVGQARVEHRVQHRLGAVGAGALVRARAVGQGGGQGVRVNLGPVLDRRSRHRGVTGGRARRHLAGAKGGKGRRPAPAVADEVGAHLRRGGEGVSGLGAEAAQVSSRGCCQPSHRGRVLSLDSHLRAGRGGAGERPRVLPADHRHSH